jgi:hypothetical protein
MVLLTSESGREMRGRRGCRGARKDDSRYVGGFIECGRVICAFWTGSWSCQTRCGSRGQGERARRGEQCRLTLCS